MLGSRRSADETRGRPATSVSGRRVSTDGPRAGLRVGDLATRALPAMARRPASLAVERRVCSVCLVIHRDRSPRSRHDASLDTVVTAASRSVSTDAWRSIGERREHSPVLRSTPGVDAGPNAYDGMSTSIESDDTVGHAPVEGSFVPVSEPRATPDPVGARRSGGRRRPSGRRPRGPRAARQWPRDDVMLDSRRVPRARCPLRTRRSTRCGRRGRAGRHRPRVDATTAKSGGYHQMRDTPGRAWGGRRTVRFATGAQTNDRLEGRRTGLDGDPTRANGWTTTSHTRHRELPGGTP